MKILKRLPKKLGKIASKGHPPIFGQSFYYFSIIQGGAIREWAAGVSSWLHPSRLRGWQGPCHLLNYTVQEEQFLDLQLPFNSMIYNLMSCGPILSMYKLSELPWHYQKCPLHLNNCHCALFAPLPPWLSIFSTLSLLAGTHTDRFW